MKAFAILILSFSSLISYADSGAVEYCQVDNSLFQTATNVNPDFNLPKAMARYKSECAELAKNGSFSDDDLRGGLSYLQGEVEMMGHCESVDAFNSFKLNNQIPLQDQTQIQGYRQAFINSKAEYISPETAIENIERYKNLSDVTDLRMKSLAGYQFENAHGKLQIRTNSWTLIYTDLKVRAITLQLGACKMIWDGLQTEPTISIRGVSSVRQSKFLAEKKD